MFAIASNRHWHRNMVATLCERTGRNFTFIDNKQQLTEELISRQGIEKIFFPHWSYIIPRDVYEKVECIIFHMTDLPYGRGGSPLQNLIVRGHKETVISALRCSEGVDTGPIYLKRPLSLEGSAQAIFERSSRIIENMIIEIIDKCPEPLPQIGQVVDFSRRKLEDGNWENAKCLTSVYDFIRMLDAEGYPRSFVEVNQFHLEFEDAKLHENYIEARVRITVRSQSKE